MLKTSKWRRLHQTATCIQASVSHSATKVTSGQRSATPRLPRNITQLEIHTRCQDGDEVWRAVSHVWNTGMYKMSAGGSKMKEKSQQQCPTVLSLSKRQQVECWNPVRVTDSYPSDDCCGRGLFLRRDEPSCQVGTLHQWKDWPHQKLNKNLSFFLFFFF